VTIRAQNRLPLRKKHWIKNPDEAIAFASGAYSVQLFGFYFYARIVQRLTVIQICEVDDLPIMKLSSKSPARPLFGAGSVPVG
jgi:hypothetical protein